MEDTQLEQWIDEYRKGDLEALGRIVDATRRPLFSVIHNMVRNGDEAEDLFQDVWIRAVRSFPSYEHRENRFLPWLFRIARNRLIDLRRKKKPDVSLQQPLGASHEGTIEDLLPSSLPHPDRQSGNQDLAARIRIAVQELPHEQRETFLLRTEGFLSFREIAELQDISINTALARMQYALRKLREHLKTDYEDLLGSVTNQ